MLKKMVATRHKLGISRKQQGGDGQHPKGTWTSPASNQGEP
jgi:hypothetical protein